MITKKNLKDLLTVLGFVRHGDDAFAKSYGALDKSIVVDFGKETITWPEGLTARDNTTSNFTSPENFVVLECVDRLLSKRYRPEHLVLEEKWLLGHEQKGGKADICVYDDENRLLLIIECKTSGEEFRKYKRQLFLDGGQLFSYWQQNRTAQWLCLYASDLVNSEDGLKVSYADSMVVLNCEDDKNLVKTAEKDDSVHLYCQAHTVEQLFQVWDETYNKQTYPDVIFGPDSQAYRIGVRPLKKKDLRQFSPDDGIVNRFLEILRHNNVSDRENAFNKLVSLFVCKLVDEVTKGDDEELDFQYRVIQDSYEDLQDRLQRLYRDGMKEFMGERIFYVENDYADKLFAQYSGAQRRRAISQLRETIRKLKFYSNNEFAFKDVHNEELFLQNGKILVEVVQLFEPYRIVYPARDQLLGDLFEQLLAKGFKQNEGQFFTATPITRFIWDSLPIDRVIHRGGKMCHPRVIDYACGAGHFLTEAVEAINSHFMLAGGKPSKDNAWVEKFIYGVEKDYRLARVSKVSLHMNGAGKGQIVFGDGLENYPDRGIDNGQFDILVANPPYSVEAFKSHLKLKNNDLELLDRITDQGSEIEALFVERIAQLLKPRGIAAVVLPSTLLTTGEGPYVGAREQLLDNFHIRAIVGLGKNAFQATSTETIILFLEKYDEPPKRASMVADSVDAILSGKPPSEWEDREIFDAYVVHIGVAERDYLDFVSGTKSWVEWREHPYFGVYCKAFEALSEFRAKRTQRAFLKLSAAEQDAAVSEWFYDYWIKGIERDKLMSFGLVYQQKTLVVKSPDDKNEERAFLGYSWSNRRGQEGIKIENEGGLLYAPQDRQASGTIAAGIRDAFNETPPAIETGAEYTRYLSLRDLIDFSRAKFDMAISLSPHRTIILPPGMVHLEKVCEYATERIAFSDIRAEDYITTDNMLQKRCGVVPYSGNAVSGSVVKYQKGDILVSNIRPYLRKIWFANTDGGCSPDVLVLRSRDSKKYLPEYLFACLSDDAFFEYVMEGKSGVKMPRGDKDQILRYPICDTSVPIQQKIVAECTKVDAGSAECRRTIAEARQKIEKLVDAIRTTRPGDGWKCGDVGDFLMAVSNGGVKVAAKDIASTGRIPVVTQETGPLVSGYTNDVEPITDVPLIVFGDHSCVFKYVDFPFVRGADGTQLLKFDAKDFDAKFMSLYLQGCAIPNANSYERHMKYLKSLKIAVPPLAEQVKVVAQVEKLEKAIADAETILSKSSSAKAAILDKYLR